MYEIVHMQKIQNINKYTNPIHKKTQNITWETQYGEKPNYKVRLLCPLFFKCKCKERDKLCYPPFLGITKEMMSRGPQVADMEY
jgi:hypothetical protein